MISILETISRCQQFLMIECSITQIPFRNYKEISPKSRGVYILEDDLQQPIYVGKGWIRTRQSTHWDKALGQTKPYQIDPKGWQQLRESNCLNPREWTIYYTELSTETAITAMEGALIHLLQPLANDETYRDMG